MRTRSGFQYRSAILILLIPGTAYSQRSVKPDIPLSTCARIDPKAPIEGRTRVLILGTTHLASLGESFRPSVLNNLMSVLAKYHPDLIGVESMPPSLIEEMERRQGPYVEVLNRFAKDRIEYGHRAQKLLGVSRNGAEQLAASILKSIATIGNGDNANRERSKLVLSMLAAYEVNSALLQWSYLPESDRVKNEVVSADFSSFLNEQLASPNEVMAIGIRLANKLRIQKVESVDDHEDEDLSESIESQLEEGNKKEPVFESVNRSPLYIESEKKFREAVRKGDLLPYYRYLNSTNYALADVTQWGAFFRTHFPGGADRSNVALWELRNLNIASHIRRATALHPGKSMLVIIGAAHKPFLDAYLCQMIDVKLVHFEDILPQGDHTLR